jgi:hypothetical protein
MDVFAHTQLHAYACIYVYLCVMCWCKTIVSMNAVYGHIRIHAGYMHMHVWNEHFFFWCVCTHVIAIFSSMHAHV